MKCLLAAIGATIENPATGYQTHKDDPPALFADDPGVQTGIFEYRVAKLDVFYPWRDPASAL